MVNRLPLPTDRAHLWYVRTDPLRDPGLLEAYMRLMTPEEVEQHGRFVFPEGRHEYLLTRALVRTVLSKYAPVAPEDWRFVRNQYGRPEIDWSKTPRLEEPPLRFNLSNTKGLISCIVALDREVGSDVEDALRRRAPLEIADRYFAPSELQALRRLPADGQPRRFFEYWTLKEAYIKARGMGLAIPLDQFWFELDGGGEIGIAFDPRLEDLPSSWQFQLFEPTERHLLAAAVRKGKDAPLKIEPRETVPLLD